MSQKTKSIADALKTTPVRRPLHVPEDPVEESEKTNAFERSDSAHENSDVVIESPDSPKETTSSEDLIARLSRLQASSKDDDQEISENHHEEPPHRATSRPLQRSWQKQQRQVAPVARKLSQNRQLNSRFESNDNYSNENEPDYEPEYEDENFRRPNKRPVSNYQEDFKPVRKPQPPASASSSFRTSRRGLSARPVHEQTEYSSPARSPVRRVQAQPQLSKTDSDDQEHTVAHKGYQARSTSRGRSEFNSPHVAARYRNISTPHKPPSNTKELYEERWSTDEYEPPQQPRGRSNQSSGFRVVGSEKSDRSSSRQFEEENHYEDFDQSEKKSAEPSTKFTGLPKNAVIKISKLADVSSISADVHETLKDLAGTFVYDILTKISESTSDVTFNNLDPVVEHHLGKPVEDLDQSFLSTNVFSRWVKSLADEFQVRINNGAILFLQQAVEFYLVELMANSRDVAERARRSRVTSQDISLASRMK